MAPEANGASPASELERDLAAFAPRPRRYRCRTLAGETHELQVIEYADLPYGLALEILAAEEAVQAASNGRALLEALRTQTRLLLVDPPDGVLDQLSRRHMMAIARLSLGLDPHPPAPDAAIPFEPSSSASGLLTSSGASRASTDGATAP